MGGNDALGGRSQPRRHTASLLAQAPAETGERGVHAAGGAVWAVRPVPFPTYRLCLASEAERHLTLRLAAEEEDRLGRLTLAIHHRESIMSKEKLAEKQHEGKKKKRLNKDD